MHQELIVCRDRLNAARCPEDVFGTKITLLEAKRIYRKLAQIAHADHYHTPEEQAVAHDAFTKLVAFWTQAQDKFRLKTYGQRALATIQSRLATYTLSDVFWGGDLSTVYKATDGTRAVILKVARSSATNDLLAREAALLATLQQAAGTSTFRHYFPTLIESIRIVRNKEVVAVNVLTFADGYVPLTDVVAAYPEGVDPHHYVWMWNRLLTGLGFVHAQGVKHGAILPPHVLVDPATHGLMLVDWAYGWGGDGRVHAIVPGYKGWYAPEVLEKKPCGRRTDLFQAAACMAYVLGGDWKTGEVPKTVPAPFARFLAACMIRNPARRRPDAEKLFDEFALVAEAVYGKRHFVPLVLATR